MSTGWSRRRKKIRRKITLPNGNIFQITKSHTKTNESKLHDPAPGNRSTAACLKLCWRLPVFILICLFRIEHTPFGDETPHPLASILITDTFTLWLVGWSCLIRNSSFSWPIVTSSIVSWEIKHHPEWNVQVRWVSFTLPGVSSRIHMFHDFVMKYKVAHGLPLSILFLITKLAP